MGETHVKIVYISPAARKAEEEQILQIFLNVKRGRAEIFGDMKARHKDWDHRKNQRRTKLKQWAMKHNWKIRTPDSTTCTNQIGTSNPDIFLIKNLSTNTPEIVEGDF